MNDITEQRTMTEAFAPPADSAAQNPGIKRRGRID